MKIFRFETETWLPGRRDEVFLFFADARNLSLLTPPWLRFEVLTAVEIPVAAGTLINYRLRFHGIPIRWRSEITVWEPPYRFVDEQRRGPYRQWIHEHTFVEREGGTLAGDRVDYAVPGGALVNRLLVARDLERVFAFRQDVLRDRFG